jgi:DNA helicase II / ATP-dependent DNA helicase PcrA
MVIGPDQFTDRQREVYSSRDRLVLVTGGPGTGKTAVALWSARRALEIEPAGSSRRALFLTFSRAAVGELLQRAPGVLSGELGQRVEISTFHGFAVSLLNAFGRYAGRGTEEVQIITEAEEALSIAGPGALRYREILPTARALLDQLGWLRAEYTDRYAIVVADELQDATSDMHELLDSLTSRTRLLCLADLDQMIYEGLPDSDVSARRLEEFRARRPREIELEPQSHRDPTDLVPRIARALLARDFADPAWAEGLTSGRLLVRRDAVPLHDVVVDALKGQLAKAAGPVGIFVSQRKMVQELADRLRNEGIEHEIAGLGTASGQAQLAVAAMAQFAVDEGDWTAVRQQLAVFYAASTRASNPPALAFDLAGDGRLPVGLERHLNNLADALTAARGHPTNEFFALIRGFWATAFAGEYGIRLWELGVDDLQGQLLTWFGLDLDAAAATSIVRVARQRHTALAVDELPAARTSVRLMTTHQAKGRELGAVIVVHDPRDYRHESPTTRGWATATRLQYVAVSRARHNVVIVLPPDPNALYAPLARLAR